MGPRQNHAEHARQMGVVLTNIGTGEKIKMEVFARYNPGSGSLSDVVANLVSAATTSMNATSFENPAAYAQFNAYLPGFVNSVSYQTGEPKAYINYILFDATYSGTPQFGYVSVPASSGAKWEKLSMEITVPAGFNGGFAYIYVTNESNYNVFFDDFLIVHEKSNMALRVTESADYYPFGLLIAGTRYVDEGRLENAYGYQGDYSEFDARTGWNRFELRGNYDSRIGKWQSSDPFPQYPSPYNALGNNAVNMFDPSGGIALNVGAALARALEGFAAGSVIGLAVDSKNWWKYGAGFAAAGFTWGLFSAPVDVPGDVSLFAEWRANFDYTLNPFQSGEFRYTIQTSRGPLQYGMPQNWNYTKAFKLNYEKPIKDWLKKVGEKAPDEIIKKIANWGLPVIHSKLGSNPIRPVHVGGKNETGYPNPSTTGYIYQNFNPGSGKRYGNPHKINPKKNSSRRPITITIPEKYEAATGRGYVTIRIWIDFQLVR